MATSSGSATTTVRVATQSKARIERLRDQWQRLKGERPTQQDLLEKALEYLEEHAEAFITDMSWQPWSEAEIDRFMSWIEEADVDGVPTDLSQDIDIHLYGDRTESGP